VSIAHADQEMPAVLEPALREVDLPYDEPGSLAAQEAGLVAVCARVAAVDAEVLAEARRIAGD
jgi:hypothetical protein